MIMIVLLYLNIPYYCGIAINSNISVIAIVFTIIFLSSLSLYADNYYDIPIIIAFLILLLFYHYYANYIPMISSFVITMIFLLLP